MKTLYRLFLLLGFFQVANAQVEKPATWEYYPSKAEVKEGETIELIFKATIQEGWYMYSVGKFDAAPPTNFMFEKNKTYQLIGSPLAIKDKKKLDQYIGEYRYFEHQAEFRQKVKILSQNPVIKGLYEYSTCSNVTGVCLPPKEEEFIFSGIVVNGKLKEATTPELKTPITTTTRVPVEKSKSDTTALTQTPEIEKASTDTAKAGTDTPALNPGNEEGNLAGNNQDLFGLFVLSFLAGLAALLTPCVFPMIPMTVTFFLKSGQSKAKGVFKALVYGFSIIFIYTVIGTIVAKLAGAEAANFLSTHWLPNLFFFAIFIVFALSFLGLFEITLPSWLVNASDRQADKGGMIGIFFMASTLVLVSFSCTGPIVGSILVQSAGGATLRPIIGMFGFSLAFAIPFTLFAIFPQWLEHLPKSGGWLNSVKVVLGFLELALAFKFLSLADQAYHWGILDRDVNIAIWIAIFAAMGLYLMGFIVLPHDDKLERIGVIRLIMAIITFSFVFYLVPGLWGAPLKPLSGYLPPLTTQDFNMQDIKYSSISQENLLCQEKPRFSDRLELPHNIKGYFDYKEALACAKKLNKPVFIDFTGHGCVNCREMEANVWSDPEVLKRLKNDFIVLALYVDDKTELPENEWYKSTYDGKVKKSIGKQNADFQITRYNTNAQPYYVVVDGDGNTLSGPVAYDLNVDNFIKFLDKGNNKVGD